MSDIMKNIKRLRQKNGLTQEELAEKLHVTRQAVSNWETGKNLPDIDTLKNLAQVFEVDVKELLYGPAPDEDRRRRVLLAGILCALALVARVLYFFLIQWANAEAYDHYNLMPRYLCLLYFKPLTYLLLGAAIPAVLFISRGLRIKNRSLRGTMVGVSILYCAVFWLLGARMLSWIPLPVPRAVMYFYGQEWCQEAWTFLIPGVLLFCGLFCGSGRKGSLRDKGEGK